MSLTSTPKTSRIPRAVDDSPDSPFTTPEVATMRHASLLQLNPQSVSKIAAMFYQESLQKEAEAFFALGTLVVFIAAHYISFFWFIYQLNRACNFDFIVLGIEAFLIFCIMLSCCARSHFSRFYPLFLLGLILLLSCFTSRTIVFFARLDFFHDTVRTVIIYGISIMVLSIISVMIVRARNEKQNYESFQKSRRIVAV